METSDFTIPETLLIRPAAIFAFMRILGYLVTAIVMLLLAWRFWPGLTWFSLIAILIAAYRYWYIRHIKYLITAEYLQICQGLIFKRVDTVELFRIKDYVLIQPVWLQIMRLMDLNLKTTDPENRNLWLRGIPCSDLVETLRERVLATRRSNGVYELN